MMEVSIFPKPPVAPVLEHFVEARLHLDDQESATAIERSTRFKEYQKRLVGSTGQPIYAVISPDAPEELILRFDGADLSGGTDFAAFLRQALEKLPERG